MNKILPLIFCLLLASCAAAPNQPMAGTAQNQSGVRTAVGANAALGAGAGGASRADAEAENEAAAALEAALMVELLNSQASGGGGGSSSGGDAWADTCGPNAGYEEQLVCSGVPGAMVPRG